MGRDSTSRTLLILAGLALVGWAIWLVRDILPPFLIAFALALLLDPLRARLERLGIPRGACVALIFVALLAVVFGVVALVAPTLVAQILRLVGNLDVYGEKLQAIVEGWMNDHAALLRQFHLPVTVSGLWEQNQKDLTVYLQGFLNGTVTTLQSFAARIGWLAVIPIVTLYLLMDLDTVRARLLYLIAEQHREEVALLAAKIGGVFAAYLRGLTTVCFAYGVLVYMALELAWHLPYALVLALAAAVLYAVPYLGQLTLLVTCAVVAWVTGQETGYVIGLAVTLLLIGQLFDQVLTPRVVGQQVGLHPVIGLFALMVGGELFGLAGMVVAVPVAASVRVVLIEIFPRLAEPLPGQKPRRRLALFPFRPRARPKAVLEPGPVAETERVNE